MTTQNTVSQPEQQVEEWRPISDYPNYEVSDLGRVRTCKPHARSRVTKPWSILRPYSNGRGYQVVSLYRDGKVKKHFVHRLVLEAFVGPCPEGMEARHTSNNDRSDNRLRNLAWGTRADNQSDRKSHGTYHCGQQCHAAKLTPDLVLEIHNRWRNGGNQTEMAATFGVRRETIWKAIHGKHWKHISPTKAVEAMKKVG